MREIFEKHILENIDTFCNLEDSYNSKFIKGKLSLRFNKYEYYTAYRSNNEIIIFKNGENEIKKLIKINIYKLKRLKKLEDILN